MSVISIPPNPSIDELIDNLSQLDSPTLDYIVSSLHKVQKQRTEQTMMSENEFWRLLQKIDWTQRQDIDKLKPLIKTLTVHSTTKIFQFSERLAFLLHQIDGPAFAKTLEKGDLGYSADSFLYARCFVVAKGKKFYHTVQSNAKNMPFESYLEALLYVPKQAYELKTKQVYTYIPSINYESFFNEDLWGEEAIIL